MATNTRAFVGAPTKLPLTYGLFSVAEIRPEPKDGNGRVDPHWKNGVTWDNVCPDARSTYDQCILTGALGSPVVSGAPKAATASRAWWGATPFTILVEIDCSTPEYWKVADETVAKTFTEAEQFEVESVFFSGTVGDTEDLQFPHLAAASELTDPAGTPVPATLQLAAANVGPTGGIPLDVVEAMGKLESALSTCVKGVGVIHVPCELLPHLVAQHLLHEENGILYSPAGHRIAVSSAYTGASPDGVVTDGVQYMYATGPVFMYHDTGKYVGDRIESLDRSVNTLKRLYERTYVIGYDCCLFTVAVSTGGIITGTPNVAT
jgi:hypothetical protein